MHNKKRQEHLLKITLDLNDTSNELFLFFYNAFQKILGGKDYVYFTV